MNWKYEAIEKLKGYEAHCNALKAIPAEIKRLELAATSIRSAITDGTPVSGGGSTREDVMLSNIVCREEQNLLLEQAKRWVEIVDGGLAVLDGEERLVLERFYIHRAKGNVERLCDELHLEKSRVYELKDKALRHFTIALYGLTET